MAVYKVPQDVEAEDKFLGPLTFKQFLFGGGLVITGYLMFFAYTKNAAWLSFILLPFFIFFAAFTFPWSKDQPTELWLASRIRFLLVPRTRIWDQSGVKNLVKITAPKKVEHHYTDGLSNDQVKTRLNALATVVDSRGWAIKNLGNQPDSSDRLIHPSKPEISKEDDALIKDAIDVMDEQENPIGQQLDAMIAKSEKDHHDKTLSMVDSTLHNKTNAQNRPSSNNDWYASQSQNSKDPIFNSMRSLPRVNAGRHTNSNNTQTQDGLTNEEERKLLDKIHQQQKSEKATLGQSHLKTILPLSAQQSQASVHSANDNYTQNANDSSKTPVDPDILQLSQNDDLNIETIARQADKTQKDDDGEVVISLH